MAGNLRTVPIHACAHRDNLFMGGDREMVMFSGVLSSALVFTGMDWIATIYGVFLWIFSVFVFRLMAKSDPKMRLVYLRHIRYQKFYQAHSTPYRINTDSQGRIYK